jgi:hypothetical protein
LPDGPGDDNLVAGRAWSLFFSTCFKECKAKLKQRVRSTPPPQSGNDLIPSSNLLLTLAQTQHSFAFYLLCTSHSQCCVHLYAYILNFKCNLQFTSSAQPQSKC